MFFSKLKPSFKWGLTAILCWLIPLSAFSQIAITTQSNNLVVCGSPDTFSVTITNQSANTLTGINIGLSLAEGVSYVPTSVNGTGIAELSLPASDTAIFSANDLPGFQSVNFTFQATASCSASDSAAVFNTISFSHSSGTDTVDSSPYDILRPAIGILSITPSSVTDTLGGSFSRCVQLVNGGLGPLSEFQFAIEVDTSRLAYSNFTISPSTAITPTFVGDSMLFTFSAAEIALAGDGDSLFEQNEVIEICYDLLIQSCEDIPSTLYTSWGCNAEQCEVNDQNANVIIQDAAPLLAITRIFERNLCYGAGASTTKLVVTNNGSGPATNIRLGFWVSASTAAMSALDTASIMWVDTAGNAIHLIPDSTLTGTNTGNQVCRGPNPILRVWVVVPFMDVGEQDTLIFDMNDCCRDWCGNPLVNHSCGYNYKYNGVCDTLTFKGGPLTISGANLGRVLSFAANGPTDLNPGDTAQYCIEHSSFRFFSRAAGSYASVDLVLPPNLTFVSGPNSIYFEDQQGDIWNSTSATMIGDTLRATFPFSGSGGVSLEKVNLKFQLTTNCVTACDGGIETIQYNLNQVADTSCSCISRISCYSFEVNVHCPGCPSPDGGLIFRDFSVTRDNFGLPDNDDNGIPDMSGSLDSSLIRMNYVMFGDTLKTVFNGTVDTTAANLFWDGGFAVSYIEQGNALTPISADIEIHDDNTGSIYNATMPLPTIGLIGGNDRSFSFTIDTNALTGNIPVGFVYEQDDSLVLTARYQVTTNPGSVVATRNITNDFALTNSVSSDTGSFDSYSGAFVQVGYYYTNCCLGRYNVSGCNQVLLSQNYYLSVGNCCANYSGGNIFKYEYREWAKLRQARFKVPPGYTFISADIREIRTAGFASSVGSATIPLPVTSSSNDTLFFDTSPLYQANGGPALQSDDGFYGVMRVRLEPTCASSSLGNRAYTGFDFDPIPQLEAPGSAAPTRTSYDSIRWRGPVITLTPSVQVAPGLSSTVEWEFQIENSANVEDASNAWFAFTSASGQITPISVTDLQTNTVVTPVGGIYQVGLVEADSIRTFRMVANYSNCDLDSILVSTGWNCPSYPVNIGSAACIADAKYLIVDPQPSDLQATLNMPSGPFDICDSIPIEINILSSQLANVQDVFVNFLLPLTGGLEYAPGSAGFRYPDATGFSSIADPNINGTQVSFDIDSISALIEAMDLPGSVNPDSNSFTLRFVLTTDCDFASGRRFLVQVLGNRVCGDALPPTLLFSPPIDISGANATYSTTLDASIAQSTTCPDVQSLDIVLVNTGLGATGPGDSIFVDLNSGYAYGGNFSGGMNPPAVTAPAVQTLPGGTRLSWEMPQGLTVGDSITFSFDVDVSSLVACGTDFTTVSSEVNSSLFCTRTATNCNASVVTGSVVLNIPINRPDLSLTNFVSTIGPGPMGFEYVYSGAIENNGVDITPGTTTNVQFYCDSDQSGTLNPGDNLIGTFPTTSGIVNGSPVNFSGSFDFNNTVCTDSNQIFAIIAPDTLNGYCLCDSAFANTNVVLPVAWLEAKGQVLPQGNLIHWEAQVQAGHERFEVERLQGQNWELASSPIFGTGSIHDWIDENPRSLEQYRVRALDQNGNSTYSQTILLDRSLAQSCSIFPNPAHALVYFDGPGGTPYRILNLTGQEIGGGMLEDGLTPFDLAALAKGVYLVEFSTIEGLQVERLVVE